MNKRFKSTKAYYCLKPLDTFGTDKKKMTDLQIRFTEGNGERLLLKYYSTKCFTF